MRLIITSDIHGYYPQWQKLKEILLPEDVLVIAGDLYGDKYPSRGNPYYQPEKIINDFKQINNKKHFVYGNCDLPKSFPGQKEVASFKYFDKMMLLYHGDVPHHYDQYDVIISGHTHMPQVEIVKGKLFLNPGSLAKPKNGISTYVVFEAEKVFLVNMSNDEISKELLINT